MNQFKSKRSPVVNSKDRTSDRIVDGIMIIACIVLWYIVLGGMFDIAFM